MSLTLNTIVPESWEEEQGYKEDINVSVPIKTSAKMNKWVKKYPELAQHCPTLPIILKSLNEQQAVNILKDYLEAVSLWKPKVAVVVKRNDPNKDNKNYQLLYNRWIELIACVGLKENSTILERQYIQTILEKCTNKKIEKTKYVLNTRNVYNIP